MHDIKKKKRGRPKKNQNINYNKIVIDDAYNKSLETNINSIENDKIILELPITAKDIKRYIEKNKLKKYENNEDESDADNNESNIISDLESTNKIDNHFTENDTDSEMNIESLNKSIFSTLEDQESNFVKHNKNDMLNLRDIHLSGNSTNSDDSSSKLISLNNKVAELKKTIDEQNNYILVLENIINTNNIDGIKNRDTKMHDLKLVDYKNGKQIVKENVNNIACWWCTYEFDTEPYFLPIKYYEGTYYVLGCFCKTECVVAYNFSMNDYNVWQRYSLIRSLYNIHPNSNTKIGPCRESYEKFGGPYSNEDYRKNCNKTYRLIIPPLSPINPYIEEEERENVSIKKYSSKMNIIGADGYRLRRSLPLPGHNKNILNIFND